MDYGLRTLERVRIDKICASEGKFVPLSTSAANMSVDPDAGYYASGRARRTPLEYDMDYRTLEPRNAETAGSGTKKVSRTRKEKIDEEATTIAENDRQGLSEVSAVRVFEPAGFSGANFANKQSNESNSTTSVDLESKAEDSAAELNLESFESVLDGIEVKDGDAGSSTIVMRWLSISFL